MCKALASSLIVFCVGVLPAAQAQEKLTFQTSWYAQAEHAGFYQALARGFYRKQGLDVTIKMGGPQVNVLQLLVAGQTDVMMGYDFQALTAISQGMPVITVGTSFQHDLQGLMTHADVSGLNALKGHTILVSNVAATTYLPWLKSKFGLTDAQIRPYTFNLQPFFIDKSIAQQAYLSSEPFQAQKNGVKAKFFLFADEGYPPYGTTIVTTQKLVKEKPDVVAAFVRASIEGWKDFLADPAPASALIKKDNPNMSDEQIAYAISKFKELGLLTGGDAARMGIGIITDERWKKTFDYMTANGLLKQGVDFRQAYTTRFVRELKIMP